jgi:signal transduction histidine kinase
MKPPSVRLRAAIGGKWLVYIPPFAWLLPVWLSGSILSTRDLNNGNDVLLVMAINIVALLLCSAEYLLFRVTIWRASHDSPARMTPLWLVVVGGLILGASKAAFTVYASAWVFGEPTTDLWGRVLAGSFLGVVVVIMVPVALSQLELYRSRREQLITEIVRREVKSPTSSDHSDQVVLEEFVAKSLATLSAVRAHPESLPTVLDDMRVNEIRPLSHHIWKREQEQIPDFTLANLTSVSLGSTHFPVFPVVIGYAALMGPSLLESYGVGKGILALMLQSGLIAALLGIAKLFPLPGRRWGLKIYFLTNIVITAAVFYIASGIFGYIPRYLPVQAALAVFQVLLTLTYFTSVFSLTRKTYRAVEQDLLSLTPDLGVTELKRAQQTRADRDFAQLLHSQVQNVFLAKSVQVKREMQHSGLSPTERATLLEQSLADLESYIQGLATANLLLPNETLATRLKKLNDAWSPVLNLTLTAGDIEENPALEAHADIIIGVLNEGISNAVRHGLAESVTISVDSSRRAITITIDDDGLGPRNGASGLGTFLFMSIPHSSWELVPSTTLGGATLTVKISL